MKTSFNKIKLTVAGILLLMAKNAFNACLLMFVVAVGVGAAIMYGSYASTNGSDWDKADPQSYFNEKNYSEVVRRWQEDEKAFNSPDVGLTPLIK